MDTSRLCDAVDIDSAGLSGWKLTMDTTPRQTHLPAQDIETLFGLLGRVSSSAFWSGIYRL